MKNWFMQLWPVAFLLVVLALVIFYWRQSASLEQIYIERTEAELQARARLLSREAEALIRSNQLGVLQAFCREEGVATETRITVISADGRVLADSQEDPARMDNHRLRPEIIGAVNAFRDGRQYYLSIRHSSTLGRRLIYCASPIMVDGRTYVLRTAFSIHRLDQMLNQARLDIVLAVLITVLATGGLCYLIFLTVSRPVLELCRASRLIAGGDLDTRLPVPSRGAIRELADCMSHMAEELKSRINEISREKSERDAIFSALAEGVIVLDLETRVIDINAAARRMFMLEDDPLGQEFSTVIRNLELAGFLSRLRAAAGPEEAEFAVELPHGTKLLRVRGSQLRWSGSHDSGLLLVIYDMTQLRKLENFRRDFVANVSHEIKTPLTVIRGAIETLRDGAIEEPESAARFMQIIDLHAERLNALVQDILSLSKLECRAVGGGCELIETDVATPVSTAVELAQARADEAGLKLVTDIQAHPVAKIDVQLIEQAVFNLIDNAIKHSGETREVLIRLREADGNALIEVIDHGCGIPLEHQPRIFERFYRVDKARSRKAGGTGLGLAIVKHVMQLHHGSAEVSSRAGEGCTFTLRLPIA